MRRDEAAEGTRHEILVDGLGVAGDGVGRLPDGRVVFVAGALPGDRVRVRLAETKKRVQFAELLEILEPSPERTESRCKLELCGGCPLKGLSLAAQSDLKRQRVVETMRRLGGLDVAAKLGPVVQVGDGWRARHRVRLHAAFAGKRWRLGYHERHSNRLVPISSCPVIWPELEQAALGLVSVLDRLPEAAGLTSVEVAYSRRDGRAGAKLTGEGPVALYVAWLREVGLELGVEIEAGGKSFRSGNLELRYDHRRAEAFDLRFEPGVFTQAHPQVNDRMVDTVLGWVRPGQAPRVLELHAGIGNFSLPMALAGTRVVAVERQRRAAVLCARNARTAGLELEVQDTTDEEALARLEGFDTVVLDPPRAGARAVAEALGPAKDVRRVVYVSCDPATLARDAAILTAGGFGLSGIEAFDMFPETPHVETVVLFER